MIVDQVFEHEIPQNKKVILNTKVTKICVSAVHPDMMYKHDNIVTVSVILAVILFYNFEREKLKIELGMGQIWN